MAAIGCQRVFHWRESTPSTTLSLVFLCFTLSLPPSIISLSSLHWFYWHESWHVSPKHTPTEIDQSLNKSRCQPSLRLFLWLSLPFCVSYFLSVLFPFCYWLFWSWHNRFSLPSIFSVLSPSLFLSSLSRFPALSGEWHALCLFNCYGLARIEEDEGVMSWGGEGSVEKGIMNG